MSNERFIKVYSQGVANITEIWVDKVTGVNYVFHLMTTRADLPRCLTKMGSLLLP